MARLIAEKSDLIAPLAEVFREYGFEGATLARISAATGLGKGSLYHFFPGGKEEMAKAVLAEIAHWFESHIFTPLGTTQNSAHAIAGMFAATAAYFHTGQRVCLVGVFGLNTTRDRFAQSIAAYFTRWLHTLEAALCTLGHKPAQAQLLACQSLAAIQGGIVLARALNSPQYFEAALTQAKAQCLTVSPTAHGHNNLQNS